MHTLLRSCFHLPPAGVDAALRATDAALAAGSMLHCLLMRQKGEARAFTVGGCAVCLAWGGGGSTGGSRALSPRPVQGDLDVYVKSDGGAEPEGLAAWTALLTGAGYALVQSGNCGEPYSSREELGPPLLVSERVLCLRRLRRGARWRACL